MMGWHPSGVTSSRIRVIGALILTQIFDQGKGNLVRFELSEFE